MAVIDQKMGVVLQGEYEGYNIYIHEKNKSLEFVENVQPGWFSAPKPKVFIVDSSNIRSYKLISTHQESGASNISVGAAYLFIGRGAANSLINAVQITMHKVEIVFINGKRCLVDLKGDAFSTLETLCYSLNVSNSNMVSNTSTIDSGDIDKNIEAVKKFKELLDMGIITQEEFDQKKMQLLSLAEQRKGATNLFGTNEDSVWFVITEKCIGCTKCARNCPVGAISGSIRQKHEIDTNKCTRCGTCKSGCPVGAIKEK